MVRIQPGVFTPQVCKREPAHAEPQSGSGIGGSRVCTPSADPPPRIPPNGPQARPPRGHAAPRGEATQEILQRELPLVHRLLANAGSDHGRLAESLNGLSPDELPGWRQWAEGQLEGSRHEKILERARERRELITTLYRAGLSDREIADQIGTTSDTVRMQRSRIGLAARNRGKLEEAA